MSVPVECEEGGVGGIYSRRMVGGVKSTHSKLRESLSQLRASDCVYSTSGRIFLACCNSFCFVDCLLIALELCADDRFGLIVNFTDFDIYWVFVLIRLV
jgi:hypothetical protein